VHKNSGIFGRSESSVSTRVIEHFWQHECEYELLLFSGANASTASTVPLQRRSSHTELMTTVREAPRPEKREVPTLDVDVTWLMQQLDPALKTKFKIDRVSPLCRTPRRNSQIQAALSSAASLHRWSTALHNHFAATFRRVTPTSPSGQDKGGGHGVDLGAIAERAESLFVPVLPLFERRENASSEGEAEGGTSSGGAVRVSASSCSAPVLPRLGDVHALLAEQAWYPIPLHQLTRF
jgi:hypothetical protein